MSAARARASRRRRRSVARDRERARRRERRVHRAHDAVGEDHARSLDAISRRGSRPARADATIETPSGGSSELRPSAGAALARGVRRAGRGARRRVPPAAPVRVRYTNVDVLGRRRATRLERSEARSGRARSPRWRCSASGSPGPHVDRSATVENATVVLVVDTSRSMLSRDVAPTRLGAAKAAARRSSIAPPPKLRVGLVTFCGGRERRRDPDARPDAAAAIRRRHHAMQAGGGTAIGDALARSVELARDAFAEPERSGARGRPTTAKGAVSDPVPLRRASEPWTAASRGGRRARARRQVSRSSPSRSAPTARMRAPAGRYGGFGFNRMPDRATLRAISRDDRWRVLRRAILACALSRPTATSARVSAVPGGRPR